MVKLKRPASNAKHEQADQARPNRRQPRLISRYAGTRKPIRRRASVPTILGSALASLSCALPARAWRPTSWRPTSCGALLARGLLRCRPSGGALLRGRFLHRPFARGLLGDDLAGGFLRGLLGGGLLRRFLGSSFRHVSRPSQPSACSTNLRQCRCASESTFVLISRKRCTRTRHALNVVTIELSRALGPLIIRRRQRSHAASTQLSAACACARSVSATIGQGPHDSCSVHILWVSPRIVVAHGEAIHRACGIRAQQCEEATIINQDERIKSKRRTCSSQSNFSSSPLSIFFR